MTEVALILPDGYGAMLAPGTVPLDKVNFKKGKETFALAPKVTKYVPGSANVI